jgi:hypothetical protein
MGICGAGGGRRRAIVGAMIKARATPIASNAAAGGIASRPRRSARSRPMPLAFTTCMATFWSGCRIVTSVVTKMPPPTVLGAIKKTVKLACSVAVPGSSVPCTCARRVAAGTSLASGTMSSGSVLAALFFLPGLVNSFPFTFYPLTEGLELRPVPCLPAPLFFVPLHVARLDDEWGWGLLSAQGWTASCYNGDERNVCPTKIRSPDTTPSGLSIALGGDGMLMNLAIPTALLLA